MSRKLKRRPSKVLPKAQVSNMFQEALAHHQAGRTNEAASIYQKIIQAYPDHAEAYNHLGLIAQHNGDFTRAGKLAHKALSIRTDPGFLANLGSAYKGQKMPTKAINTYKNALKLQPNHFETLFNLANTLLEEFECLEAKYYFQKILQLWPDTPEALFGLGQVHNVLKEDEEAIRCFNRILTTQPTHLPALNSLGLCQQRLGHFDEAISTYKQAIKLSPDTPEAMNNIGNVLVHQGKLHEALTWYQKACQTQPDYEESLVNLSWTYAQHGLLKESIDCLHDLCSKRPDSLNAYSDLLINLNYDPALSNKELFTAAQGWWQRFTNSHPDTKPTVRNLSFPNIHNNKLLRIGFVSPDFRQHPVGTFLLPLFRNISKDKFEVHCYAEIPKNSHDMITAKLLSLADQWYTTFGKDDETVAQQIINDRIDILIDLAGHSAHNRLAVLARKPSPVQVSWLGYVNTTGLPVIDYRITDQITDPAGSEKFHSESLVRLPHGFFCYSPPDNSPEISPLPGLSTGTITFGSFNNIKKISGEVINIWAQVLHQVPTSKLLWVSKVFTDSHIRSHFMNLFINHGITPERIKMVGSLPMLEYLAIHKEVDIALDPFPHNGHTITCHSLWMGVPIITLEGNRYATRMGASIMKRIGLERCVAQTTDEYITKAKMLAKNPADLAQLRSSMRQRLKYSEICKPAQFARDFESALLKIWKEYT